MDGLSPGAASIPARSQERRERGWGHLVLVPRAGSRERSERGLGSARSADEGDRLRTGKGAQRPVRRGSCGLYPPPTVASRNLIF